MVVKSDVRKVIEMASTNISCTGAKGVNLHHLSTEITVWKQILCLPWLYRLCPFELAWWRKCLIKCLKFLWALFVLFFRWHDALVVYPETIKEEMKRKNRLLSKKRRSEAPQSVAAVCSIGWFDVALLILFWYVLGGYFCISYKPILMAGFLLPKSAVSICLLS